MKTLNKKEVKLKKYTVSLSVVCIETIHDVEAKSKRDAGRIAAEKSDGRRNGAQVEIFEIEKQ